MGGIPGTGLSSCELYDPQTGSWSATGSLSTDRFVHSATLLQNGKVLISGGSKTTGTYSSTQKTCELFDPATGQWSPTGSMDKKRYYHSQVLLPDGKVLVAGGIKGGVTHAGCEIYDPANGTWSTTGAMSVSRRWHTATLLPNGKVIVAAGNTSPGSGTDTNLSSVEFFDPSSGTWTPGPPLSGTRFQHAATLLPNGKLLVMEGSTSVNHAEILDPASGTWSSAGVTLLTSVRNSPSATLLPGGNVLLAGGWSDNPGIVYGSCEIYQAGSGTWESPGSMGDARSKHTATLLESGEVLLVGGHDGVGLASPARLYNPVTNSWSAAASFPGVELHTATLLENGLVLVAGGGATTNAPPVSYLYDPGADQWSPTAGSLATNRMFHGTVRLHNGRVFVAGGFHISPNSGIVTSSEEYDPTTGLWTTRASLFTPRTHHTLTILPDGKVLATGGVTNSAWTETVEIYNPATDQWTTAAPMNFARFYHTATVLSGGRVLVVGGDGAMTSCEIFDPATGQWSVTGSLLEERSRYTATLLPNGKVLVAGGYNSDELETAEVYDPTTGTWSSVPDMSTKRHLHRATLLADGRVLLSGGLEDFSATFALDTAEMWIHRA